MSTAAPTPAVPARPSPAWGPVRVLLVILGSLAALIGAALLIGRAVLMIAHLTERDDDGFLTSATEQVSSAGYAVTTEGVDLADVEDGGDWLVDQGIGTVRIKSTGRQGDLFVGIAPEASVDRYLAGVAHDELDKVRSGDNRYLPRAGGVPRVAPEEAGIWVASTSGRGTETLDWDAGAPGPTAPARTVRRA